MSSTSRANSVSDLSALANGGPADNGGPAYDEDAIRPASPLADGKGKGKARARHFDGSPEHFDDSRATGYASDDRWGPPEGHASHRAHSARRTNPDAPPVLQDNPAPHQRSSSFWRRFTTRRGGAPRANRDSAAPLFRSRETVRNPGALPEAASANSLRSPQHGTTADARGAGGPDLDVLLEGYGAEALRQLHDAEGPGGRLPGSNLKKLRSAKRQAETNQLPTNDDAYLGRLLMRWAIHHDDGRARARVDFKADGLAALALTPDERRSVESGSNAQLLDSLSDAELDLAKAILKCAKKRSGRNYFKAENAAEFVAYKFSLYHLVRHGAVSVFRRPDAYYAAPRGDNEVRQHFFQPVYRANEDGQIRIETAIHGRAESSEALKGLATAQPRELQSSQGRGSGSTLNLRNEPYKRAVVMTGAAVANQARGVINGELRYMRSARTTNAATVEAQVVGTVVSAADTAVAAAEARGITPEALRLFVGRRTTASGDQEGQTLADLHRRARGPNTVELPELSGEEQRTYKALMQAALYDAGVVYYSPRTNTFHLRASLEILTDGRSWRDKKHFIEGHVQKAAVNEWRLFFTQDGERVAHRTITLASGIDIRVDASPVRRTAFSGQATSKASLRANRDASTKYNHSIDLAWLHSEFERLGNPSDEERNAMAALATGDLIATRGADGRLSPGRLLAGDTPCQLTDDDRDALARLHNEHPQAYMALESMHVAKYNVTIDGIDVFNVNKAAGVVEDFLNNMAMGDLVGSIPLYQCKSGEDRTLTASALRAAQDEFTARYGRPFSMAEVIRQARATAANGTSERVDLSNNLDFVAFRRLFTFHALQLGPDPLAVVRGKDKMFPKWGGHPVARLLLDLDAVKDAGWVLPAEMEEQNIGLTTQISEDEGVDRNPGLYDEETPEDRARAARAAEAQTLQLDAVPTVLSHKIPAERWSLWNTKKKQVRGWLTKKIRGKKYKDVARFKPNPLEVKRSKLTAPLARRDGDQLVLTSSPVAPVAIQARGFERSPAFEAFLTRGDDSTPRSGLSVRKPAERAESSHPDVAARHLVRSNSYTMNVRPDVWSKMDAQARGRTRSDVETDLDELVELTPLTFRVPGPDGRHPRWMHRESYV